MYEYYMFINNDPWTSSTHFVYSRAFNFCLKLERPNIFFNFHVFLSHVKLKKLN